MGSIPRTSWGLSDFVKDERAARSLSRWHSCSLCSPRFWLSASSRPRVPNRLLACCGCPRKSGTPAITPICQFDTRKNIHSCQQPLPGSRSFPRNLTPCRRRTDRRTPCAPCSFLPGTAPSFVFPSPVSPWAPSPLHVSPGSPVSLGSCLEGGGRVSPGAPHSSD